MPFQTPASVRAFVVSKDDQGQPIGQVAFVPFADLPSGEVTIRVAYSSLNYKDALAVRAHPGVVKKLPHVPGIDAAGVVVDSSSDHFAPGAEVLVTGFDLGVGHWGGYCEYIRVPTYWIVPLPPGMSLRESMTYGTAGFTAALSVAVLLDHGLAADRGEVVVTGASGGVGSIALGILSKLGFDVVGVSGKPSARSLLESLGAKTIVGREAVDDHEPRPLLPARWAGAVDTVGGNILATILRSTQPGGCVTACGLVAGANVPLTVYPFILRGITLCGIDSISPPVERRRDLWAKLSNAWRPVALDELVTEIGLHELVPYVEEILAGRVTGRVVVRL